LGEPVQQSGKMLIRLKAGQRSRGILETGGRVALHRTGRVTVFRSELT